MSNALLSLQPAEESGQVIACVDRSANASAVATAAAHLAHALDRPLVLFHVLEPGNDPLRRPDPLDWELRRRQARRHLSGLNETIASGNDKVRLEVVEGERVGEICARAEAPGAILVIGARRDGDRPCAHGRTGQQVLEAGAGTVLLVPAERPVSGKSFARIMVPLDGSSFAEAALAEATRLARKAQAEILLVHVVPDAGLSLFGPPDSADFALRQQLDRRNEQAACAFLEAIGRRIADQGIDVRTACIRGDTRSMLQQAIADHRPDLVILSTRGQGGKHCRDLPMGGTASYLLAHLGGPMMLVRPTPVARSSRQTQPAPERLSAAIPSTAFAA